MKRWLWAWVVASSLAATAGGLAEAQAAATISVKINGLSGTDGQALVVLYDNAETWLNTAKAVQVLRAKISGAELNVDLRGVKPGTYAIAVVHDANANDKLDMRWLPYPKPKEGVGYSNDAESKAGPPKWEAAKFDVGAASTALNIAIKYP
jgi:uncharacterized protein (DUF2141 family)